MAMVAIGLGLLADRVGGQPAQFTSEARVVVFHVAVQDKKGYVGGLEERSFHIIENQQRHPVAFFSDQDAPVTVGLLIDGSGSMGGNRDRVAAAGVAFAESSNPEDDIFVLGFNERVTAALPETTPFTRDIPTLRTALDKAIASRGQSAVYDAVAAGLTYLDKGQYERKVLVLVSDGGDNASALTRAAILARAQGSNALIYSVGLVDPLESEADPGFLKELSDASGGQSFEPHNLADVRKALGQVARDIRHMYTVGYVPSDIAQAEQLRRVRVEVSLPGGRKASVRTRRAYLAGSNPGTLQ
jgi:Ca-activated chloride channel homolog